MTALRRILTAAFLVLTLSPAVVHACSCAIGGNGCGHGSLPDDVVVFLGRVTDKVDLATPDNGGPRDLSSGYLVHFSVSEAFRMGNDSGGDLVVYTGSGGGDCGYPFVIGSSYLVFASSYKGQLSTGICSGTKPENRVSGLLKQLRAIRDTGHGFDLFGTAIMLDIGSAFSNEIKAEPLANISVRVIGSRGTLFSTTTDEHGAYTLAWLPPDTYHVEHDLPPGLTIAGGPPEPLKIEASDKQAPGFACRFDVYANPDGRISGTVVGLEGKGVPGFLTLEPADPKEAAAAHQRGGLPGNDTEDGRFELGQLPPGRYRLIFRPKAPRGVNWQRAFYWPVSQRSNSGAIEISLGQHIDGVRFEIPVSAPEN